MSHPHVDQFGRDGIDDHNLVDHEPAGDDPEDSRTAPEPQVRQHLAGTAHTHKSLEESR
ncbi:hypothetical protein QYF68_23295 [Mycolicibacterium austroafricanum]|uniref:Uncharacterized protein n=1 Tax=Mycolicibacterium austroafricanum TaxID=39687 RepID=A0ABT8HIW2_MYCAO|nr:hypothetical protein [Mycolicibacterium austroafricanum]MDN4520718.1 hypothetical protein [Mycolicibacterium austroafricanum]